MKKSMAAFVLTFGVGVLAALASPAHADGVMGSTVPVVGKCPDLQIALHNRSEWKIGGLFQGHSGNLGSGGWSLDPYGIGSFGLPADSYPQGDVFKVEGAVQLILKSLDDRETVYDSCTADVPGLNGCPDPSVQVLFNVLENPDGSLACSLRTH